MHSLYSQDQFEVNGKILHEGKGVPFLSVYLKGTNIGGITDVNGKFAINNIPYEEIDLTICGLGYKTINMKIKKAGKNTNLVLNIERDELLLNEVLISGTKVGQLRYLPGCVSIIDSEKLKTTNPVSANEVLRSVPGLNVVEEEGAGLRLNVGIRGLDPDKSRNVLVLEDGIPVALAPYGEPEMYYSPNIERMAGVEVIKGNSSILFGPQTIGGVINYLTADPSDSLKGTVSLKVGDFGYNSTFLQISNKVNNIGFDVNYNRKQAQNFGPTSFLLHDFNTKFLLDFSPKSKLTLKMSLYNEESNSTYVGITQSMYDRGGYDYLRISPDDELGIRRYAVSANHKYLFKDGLQISTSLFGYTTTRNWNRQDFTYSSTASNLTGVMHGIEDGKESAIFMRNTTGQRNRQFEVAGIESRLEYRYNIKNITSKLDAGIRGLYEKAYEQRVDGTKAAVKSGSLRDDEIRSGKTISLFAQNKTLITEKFSLTAGLRMEGIAYDREIFRVNHKDTLISNQTRNTAVIPGIGVNYNFNSNINLFAGVHKGYAPPRTKDAISNAGVDLELLAEQSWNYELGLRAATKNIAFELTSFYMMFSNQVIPVSESSGGVGTATGYINGGATEHKGVEFMTNILVHKNTKWENRVTFSATYVNSTFSGDRFVLQKVTKDANKTPIYANINGNKTPYSPELTFNASVLSEFSKKMGVRLTGNYIGKQYTDALNTVSVNEWIEVQNNDQDFVYQQATLNGRIGLLKEYFVADASIWYKHAKTGLDFNLSVKNIFNERYITSRRPQGIRVGMPRFILGGVTYRF